MIAFLDGDIEDGCDQVSYGGGDNEKDGRDSLQPWSEYMRCKGWMSFFFCCEKGQVMSAWAPSIRFCTRLVLYVECGRMILRMNEMGKRWITIKGENMGHRPMQVTIKWKREVYRYLLYQISLYQIHIYIYTSSVCLDTCIIISQIILSGEEAVLE